MSNVLAKQCTVSVWRGEAEASVCRDYKALWAMTLVGTYVFLPSALFSLPFFLSPLFPCIQIRNTN